MQNHILICDTAVSAKSTDMSFSIRRNGELLSVLNLREVKIQLNNPPSLLYRFLVGAETQILKPLNQINRGECD